LHNKYKIFLIGGNSLIGTSIVNGLKKRYENIEVLYVVRTNKNLNKKTVRVKNYKSFINEIDQHLDSTTKNIFVLSFGILKEENSNNDLLNNLSEHIRINAYEKIFLFKKIINIRNFHEIHIVSSILSGFFRPSIGSYSISKYVLSKAIAIEIFLNVELRDKVYLWNPAFVNSKLNEDRESFLIKTSPLQIENTVSSKSKGGDYYIPRYSKYVVKFMSIFQFLINKIDRKVS
jgi:hypothetical protein|tara:strand:+ start:5044 stop:5739 length:696 start_codon:yes stop_codon:yes gene_type:complete